MNNIITRIKLWWWKYRMSRHLDAIDKIISKYRAHMVRVGAGRNKGH